eukprot:2415303-Amphidinium_carterae.1
MSSRSSSTTTSALNAVAAAHGAMKFADTGPDCVMVLLSRHVCNSFGEQRAKWHLGGSVEYIVSNTLYLASPSKLATSSRKRTLGLSFLLQCARLPDCCLSAGRLVSDKVRVFFQIGVHRFSAHMNNFPLGSIKMIQQLVVTKAVVCSHGKLGCILSSVDHLGIYAFIIPVNSVQARHLPEHGLDGIS